MESLFRGFRLGLLRREVWLRLLLPVTALLQHYFGLPGVIPLRRSLVALADVDGRPLLIVVDKCPSLPDQALNGNVAVIYSVFILRHSSVFVCITDYLQRPSTLIFKFVLGNRLQSFLQGVLSLKLLHEFLLINFHSFGNSRLQQGQTSIFEDVLWVVDPVIERGQEGEIWKLPFLAGWLDFLLVLSIDVEHSPGDYLAAEGDSDYLALEEMCLLALEMRVGINLSFKITSEDVFQPPRGIQLVRSDVRQLFPVSGQQISRHPVGVLVHSSTLRLHIRRQFTLLSSLSCTLQNVVVSLSSQDLAPEFDLLDLFGHAESLNSLEDDIGGLLSKAHSCLLEKLGLFDQIGEKSTRSWLSRLFLGANIGLIEQSLEFLGVFGQLLKLLIPEVVDGMCALFDIVGVVLEELVAIAIVGEDHLLKDLHQVIIGIPVALLDGLELRLHDLQLI